MVATTLLFFACVSAPIDSGARSRETGPAPETGPDETTYLAIADGVRQMMVFLHNRDLLAFDTDSFSESGTCLLQGSYAVEGAHDIEGDCGTETAFVEQDLAFQLSECAHTTNYDAQVTLSGDLALTGRATHSDGCDAATSETYTYTGRSVRVTVRSDSGESVEIPDCVIELNYNTLTSTSLLAGNVCGVAVEKEYARD